MQRKDRIDLLGAVLLVGFSVIMGFGQVAIKLVNGGMQPVFQAGLRSAFAFWPVLGFAMLAGRRLGLRDGTFWPGIAAGLCFSAEFLLLYLALDLTSVARAVVMFYTMPIWVALGAHFLIPGERLTPLRALGLALAVGGVALALARNGGPQADRALAGDLMALAGAAFWAALVFIMRLTPLSRAAAEMQLLYQLSVSAVVLCAAGLMTGPVLTGMTPVLWSLFAFQVVFVVSIGFLTWFWVLKVYPASDMASFAFLTPLFGVICGWLILAEHISPNIIGALAMVGAGIVLVNRRRRRGSGGH